MKPSDTVTNGSDFPPPIDHTYEPSVNITRLPAVAPIADILEVLARDGGVILTDFVSRDQLDQLNRDVRQHLDKPSNTAYDISIMPKETVLVNGLVGKSKAAAALCESPLMLQLLEHLLTTEYSVKHEGTTINHKIDPLIHTSLSLCVGPGAPRQRLHRDDSVHDIDHSNRFELSKVSQFGCLIAGTETTRANGATMVIPKSHLWDDNRGPKPEEVAFAEMKPGSALIFLGSTFHGGGNNMTDSYRIVHGLFFTRGTLRPEENQFLAIPHSAVLGMSEKMLSLLGYKKPSSTLGVVEGRDPVMNLKNVLVEAAR